MRTCVISFVTDMFSKLIRSRFPTRGTEVSTCHLVVSPAGNMKFSKGKRARKSRKCLWNKAWNLSVDFGNKKAPGELTIGIDFLSSI